MDSDSNNAIDENERNEIIEKNSKNVEITLEELVARNKSKRPGFFKRLLMRRGDAPPIYCDETRKPSESELVYARELLTCAICFDLICEPHKLHPCSHSFCSACIRGWAREAVTCPVCRARISDCQPDRPMRNALRRLFPVEYRRRKAEDRLSPNQSRRLPSADFTPTPPIDFDDPQVLGYFAPMLGDVDEEPAEPRASGVIRRFFVEQGIILEGGGARRIVGGRAYGGGSHHGGPHHVGPYHDRSSAARAIDAVQAPFQTFNVALGLTRLVVDLVRVFRSLLIIVCYFCLFVSVIGVAAVASLAVYLVYTLVYFGPVAAVWVLLRVVGAAAAIAFIAKVYTLIAHPRHRVH